MLRSPKRKNHTTQGFTLLFAVLISSVLLAIGMGIFNIVFRELQLSALTRDSDIAIFAADAGIECGLYWEFKGGTEPSPVVFDFFDPTDQTIDCAEAGIDVPVDSTDGAETTWHFEMKVGEKSCTEVFIIKDADDFTTSIESNGRNEGWDPVAKECNAGERTVERTLQVNF